MLEIPSGFIFSPKLAFIRLLTVFVNLNEPYLTVIYICTPLIIGKVNRSCFGVYSLYVTWVSVKYLGFRGFFVVVVSFHFSIEVLKKSFLINLKDFLYILVQTLSLKHVVHLFLM